VSKTIVLGFDTATLATAVGLHVPDHGTLQARDEPAPGEHPGHATRLLPMVEELLRRAGLKWRAIERIAVGVGPGTFTGLRVGVATARGLAQSLRAELVGVSSLRALAAAADSDRVLAVIDARRGEAFVAAYAGEEELVAPHALAPERLGEVLARAQVHLGGESGPGGGELGPGGGGSGQGGGGSGQGWIAVGDGAVRFRDLLEASGTSVPPDSSPLHGVDAAAICELGARAPAAPPLETIVPDYRRRPDAELAWQRGAGTPRGTTLPGDADATERAGTLKGAGR
jgi:tRNA threonylcarbamoyladenosine biosynthesis protein TsaB